MTLGMEPCDLTQDDSCHSQILDQFAENRRNCSCEVNCEDTDYDAYMSQSKWPSKMYETSAASSFGYADVPANAPGLSENLLSVNVYFKTLNVKMMSEEALYQNVRTQFYFCVLNFEFSFSVVF